ncbi:Aminotransferase [Pseudomonas cannabina pv. alisalensis]|uniref:Aminotransferase n=3 Tax=Pseudomonas TaxID=286 RepID=A0A3M3Q9Q1_PSECA|nr:aminotransferase class I/II-fold pyridoxal phosphate-dependent enzyme [Pseudomonas cannabina]KPW17440.1 Aminotransferase [Pseudomonas cannabina pv. alisalensis]MBM0142353.1 aminotransferase class I/II-fold pyridoxal phosphate-dependent enzyme [Pseudomonas cannabina pv. alisalensis]RMN78725.1 Aminotransferase [Pseudomonas cannabina pv. alisalensis]RMN80921.1 Aminotransferase [Pseudomonas cannabina]RMN93317.1 Aminotransferase [Pseudomonas cannabina]
MELLELVGRAALFKEASNYARQMHAVNLSQGLPEPLFDDEMYSVLVTQLVEGWQYADPRGEGMLRERIARRFLPEGGTDTGVLVTSGCTEALFLALMAARSEFGNSILFFEPFYPYYPGLASLCGMDFVTVPLASVSSGGGPDWGQVEAQLRDGVRILLLNTPHNPTGWCMGDEDWKQLEMFSATYDFLVILDEAYKYYSYETIDSGDLPERTFKWLSAGSASKMLSMTGVRIGWLLGDTQLVESAYARHLYLSYCQPRPLQGAVALLLDKLTPQRVDELQKLYRDKRDRLARTLTAAGFQIGLPAGGHYIMADYSHIAPQMDAHRFSQHMAEHVGVMPLAASPFYMEGSHSQVRFSFSASRPVLDEACRRMEAM